MKLIPAPLFALVCSSVFVGSSLTQANIIDWGNTGTNFNSNGSWSGGTAPGGADIARFNSTKVFDPNLNSSLTIQGLTFTAGDYTLSNSGGAALTLTNTGSNDTAQTSAILGDTNSGTNRINAPIILGGTAGLTQSISQKAGGILVINGTITNTNAITLRLAAGGTIDLAANNSATLNAPINLLDDTTLQIGNNNALGTGVLSVRASGTTIQSDSSADHVTSKRDFYFGEHHDIRRGGLLQWKSDVFGRYDSGR